jgi:hypothetical protein
MYLDTRSKKTPTWIEVSDRSSCAVSGLVSALRTFFFYRIVHLAFRGQKNHTLEYTKQVRCASVKLLILLFHPNKRTEIGET